MTKISFKATNNTVTANTYVAHELYKRNEAIVNKLGGEIIRGVGGFKAQFKTSAQAKKFVEQAVTSISKSEYNATRKSEPKAKAPASGKGKAKADNFITLTDDDGNTYKVPMSALGIVPEKKKNTTTKGKGNATPKKAVTKGKGKNKACAVDFGKLAGKGRTANKKAAELIYKTGCKPNSAEFNALWEQWCEVR